MVIHTSQGLQKVDRAESTSRSKCGDMEMTVKGLIPIPYWRQPEPLTDQLQYYATRSEEASRNAYVSCKRQEGLDRKMEAVVNELHEIKQGVNRTNELME